MEIKHFRHLAPVIAGLMISGCMNSPGKFETLEDFRRTFSARTTPAVLPEKNILTLEQAIKISLLNNPDNLAAAQAVQAAKYGYYRALSAYAPEINAGYSLGDTLTRGWDLKNPPVGVMKRNDHFVTAGTIQASWLLFDGFARELETIIARQEFSKSKAIGKNVRRLLKRAVAYAYYDILLAEEEMNIHRADLDFQNAALKQEEVQFRNGHVSKAAVLNFRILAARAKSNIRSAEYRRQVSFHALSSLMGCDSGMLPENIRLQKITHKKLPVIHDENHYLEMAIKNRPDLKAEKITVNTAYRRYQKQYADFMPEIRLFSGFSLDTYNAQYGGYHVSGAHSQQGGFNYGIEGKWNIFRGLASVNKLKEENVKRKTALWNLNAKFLEVVTEVRDARANCTNARYQVEIFLSMSLWVREQRDLVFSEYQNGRETITRLNEAQSMLVEMENRLAVSTVEFSKAAAQLAAAAGDFSLSDSGEN